MNELFNLSHWAEVLAQNGLVLLGQTSLLLGLGLLALRALQTRQADARDLLGRALLVSTLAGVALSFGFSLSGWSRPAALWNLSLPARPVMLTDTSTTSSSASVGSASEARTKSKEARDMPSASSPVPTELFPTMGSELPTRLAPAALHGTATPEVNGWRSLLSRTVALWFGGALGLVLWWGMCHEALRRLRRNAQVVEDAAILATLSEVCAASRVRVPLLLGHTKVSSPFLTGLWRPAILLPASDADLDPAMLRAIFSHEAMHLKRRDLWWNALGRLGCALLWPQPLLWMLCRQIERSSEEACDQAVLEAGCARQQYAKWLLDFAERLSPRRAERVAGIGVATGKSSIARRVQTILSDSLGQERRLSKRARWTIASVVMLGAASTPFLISGRAAPSGNAGELPLPDPQLKITGNWAVGIGSVENGLLHDVKLQALLHGRVMLSHETHTARRALRWKTPNWWMLDNPLTRTYGRGADPAGKRRKTGVMTQLPDAVTRYLLAQLQTAKARKPLEQSVNGPEGHVFIGGVSNGVLQGVSIWLSRQGSVREILSARTARRQKVGSSGETRWVLSDVDIYGFSDAQGLQSEAHAQQTVLSPTSFPASFSKWMDQQSQAPAQRLLARQWTQWQQFSTLPRSEFFALENWAKGQGRAAISGRVVGDDGQPVSGVRIYLTMEDDVVRRVSKAPSQRFPLVLQYPFMLPKRTRELVFQEALTGSDGSYRFNGLANVAYYLTIESHSPNADYHPQPAVPPQVLLKEQRVTVSADGQTTAPDLKLTRGGLIRVRVEDKATGAPLPGVHVFGASKVMAPAQRMSYLIDSDASGHLLLRLPAGTASIYIGGNTQSGSHALVAQSNGVFYGLTKGAEVSLDGGSAQPFPDRTDVQIIPGKTREMTIRLTRYVAPQPTPAPRLVPPPVGKATLIGRVVDEAGRAVAGVEVRAIIQQKAQWKLMQGAGLALSNGDTPGFKQKWASINPVLSESATTAADGSFRLDGLTTAPYNLVIASDADFGLKPPADWVADAIEGVWAKEGQQIRRATPIVLTKGALIVGRVVDKATGQGLGGVVFGSNGPQLPSSTDDVIGVTSVLTV